MHIHETQDWKFERLQNGSVRITSEQIGDTSAIINLPSDDWAKLVSGMTLSGRSSYMDAVTRAIHG